MGAGLLVPSRMLEFQGKNVACWPCDGEKERGNKGKGWPRVYRGGGGQAGVVGCLVSCKTRSE